MSAEIIQEAYQNPNESLNGVINPNSSFSLSKTIFDCDEEFDFERDYQQEFVNQTEKLNQISNPTQEEAPMEAEPRDVEEIRCTGEDEFIITNIKTRPQKIQILRMVTEARSSGEAKP